MTDQANRDQKTFWTAQAGPKWVAQQAALDDQLQGVLDGVLSRAALRTNDYVLDIGCGTGASTLAAANHVGSDGHVFGADISATLLGLAQKRAEGLSHVTFAETDAASHAFQAQSFDHLISRFGVMFFADPVAAFANMARALKPGGNLTFASWGQIPNNPYFTRPAQVARDVFQDAPPKPDPDGPGPFAFRDPERVIGLLSDAGLHDVSCEVVAMDITPSGTVSDYADVMMQIGSAESACNYFDATAAQRAELRAALEQAFVDFETPQGLRVPAEINFFTARAA